MNWRDIPPLSALRAFHAYAESRSMPRAGATLSLSHAAISKQTRNFEIFLSVPLLDRTARQAQLTDEGLALAKVLSASFEVISAQMKQMTTKDAERPLVVSTTPSFAANWLVPRLAEFRAKHPELNVTIAQHPQKILRGSRSCRKSELLKVRCGWPSKVCAMWGRAG